MDGFITIGTKLDTKQFDAQIRKLEKELDQMERSYSTYTVKTSVDEEDMQNLAVQIERTKNKLYQLRKEKEKLAQTRGTKELADGVKNLGDGIQNAVRKASKLVLGIFGIRSAFMALKRASSELATYNEEYGANLEYIRYALTQAIAPVLEYVVQLALKLLAYINAIAKAWFGVNLFENASVDNFKRMKQGVNGVTNAVSELKKQLAGFDEMNILQENGNVTTGGGGGGISLPAMDLSSVEDIEIPPWLQWIIDHKSEVLGILTAIGAALLGIKIGSFIKGLVGANEGMASFLGQAGKFITGAALVAGGFALMITGAYNLAAGWQEMTLQEKLVEVGMVALGAAMAAFGLKMMGVGGPYAAIIAIVAALAALLIAQHSEIDSILDVAKAEERLQAAKEKNIDAYNDYVDAVDRAEEAEKELNEAQLKTRLSGEELNRLVKEGTLDYRYMSNAQKEVYKAFLRNEKAQQDLANATKTVADSNRETTITEWEKQLAIMANEDEYEEYKRKVIDAYNSQELKVDEARELIEKSMQQMGQSSYDTFLRDVPENIRKGLQPARYQSVLQMLINMFSHGLENFGYSVNRWFETLINGIIKALSDPIGALKKGIHALETGNILDAGSEFLYGAKGVVVYNGLPKLASGGIINQPGRGVPIGRAIAGERGAEGVIPLTDSQQMETLGEAIGRYITINASIPISMNGRVISRELKQVQTNQDFAYNM